MNHLILNNFKEVSDDTIMSIFTHRTHFCEWMYDGLQWRGVDIGDREMNTDDSIDKHIYTILEKTKK